MRDALIDEIENLIPALRRFARSLTRDVARADDLVQDTLERALSRIESFEPGTNLRAWLFTIMRNRFISDRRKASNTYEVEPDEDNPAEHVASANQEHAVELREFERAFAELDQGEQEILLLAGLEAMPYAEIADVMDVAVGTVKSRVARARTKLRALHVDYGAIAGDQLASTPEARFACAS